MPILSERNFIKMDRLAKRKKIRDEKLVDFYQSFSGTRVPDIPFDELNDQEKAEELAYDVLEEIEAGEVDYEGILDLWDKAKKAVKLDPYCIAAYEATYKTCEHKEARDRYILKGVEMGEQKFGGDFEKKNKGYFWGITETRPFMRLLAAKAEILVEKRQKKEAMLLYNRMLEMHPDDAIGVRYPLQIMYLEFRELDKYIELIDIFADDYSAHNYYNYALYMYLVDKDSVEADEAMLEAIAFNPFVLPYLKSKKKLNRNKPMPYFNPKDETGAIIYCEDALYLWHRQFGIQNWLNKFQ